MTLEEAKVWAEVLSTVDGGGCPSCMTGVSEEANERFPEFEFYLDDKRDLVLVRETKPAE